MTPDQIATARACHEGAANGTLAFPQILGALSAAGFDGYFVDFRTGGTRYYLTEGDSTKIAAPSHAVALPFDAAAVLAAIKAAQANAPGYSYAGFCRRVTAAGCAGYLVSLPGRRVVYFGRTGDMHIEHFPPQG